VKPTLVTGATGFVGWHVARLLAEHGERVRVLVRDPAKLSDFPGAEAVHGDLTDPASLDAAVRGCATVFHAAADYRLWARDPEAIYRANVDGTRNLLEASRAAGIERFVYTSTVGCIGMPEDGRLQAVEVSGRAGSAAFRAGRISGGDRESDGAGG
jgi:dihydroflavonol-4-reductase